MVHTFPYYIRPQQVLFVMEVNHNFSVCFKCNGTTNTFAVSLPQSSMNATFWILS